MILSVAEFRGFVESALGDESVQTLLDAAEADIVRAAGAPDPVVELYPGGQRIIALSRPAASVTDITELSTPGGTVVTLAANDYLHDGFLLYRLTGGTNSRSYWHGRVTVTYVPVDDDPIRRGVQVDLIKLALNYEPGLSATTVGSWTEQYRQANAGNQDERAAILRRLSPGPSMVVIG